MNILVTGASGFIGGAFLHRFAGRQDLHLTGVGRRDNPGLPASVSWHALPLNRLQELDVVPDVVIHAAGRASPWGTRAEYARDNIETTRQVLAFCRARGMPRLIFLSTAAVSYRFAHQYHLGEEAATGEAFTSEYGRSKYCAEQLMADYEGEKTILRPCAVFGPGDRLLFPPLLAAARKRQLWRLQSAGGPAQADLLHIDALCDYLLLAATRTSLQPCYHLSSAQPVAIDALLGEVLQALSLPPVKRTMSLKIALAAAGGLERVWRGLSLTGEPPITRFGVAVFGYSSVLDVTRMLRDFGPPTRPFAQSLRAFLEQNKGQG